MDTHLPFNVRLDPFATLGLAPSFVLDVPAVERRHRDLSRALHPDRFVGTSSSERRAALAKAVEVNEAWRLLRDPVRRAEVLFSRVGIPIDHQPATEPAFLMEILELREALGEAQAAHDLGAITRLSTAVAARARLLESELAEGFESARDDRDRLEPLVGRLGQLRYLQRFLDQVRAIEDDFN